MNGERDGLGLMLRLIPVTVASGIPNRGDAPPQHFHLGRSPGLPPMPQLMGHGVPQLRFPTHPAGVECERVARGDVLAQTSGAPAFTADEANRRSGLSK